MKYRMSKEDNYTVLSNVCIQDKKLSLKARGLHALMMSLPDDWNYSIRGLAAICKDNETSVRSAVKELADAGYIKRVKVQNKKTGFHEWTYDIYEAPQSIKSASENPSSENPPSENPSSENQRQINKYKQNKYKQNKKEQSIDDLLAKIQDKRLEEALREFLKMRIEKKKPIGAAALKMLIRKLYEMADEPDTRARIVEQSVRNGWLDIYALKENYGAARDETVMSPTADIQAIETRFMARVVV